MSFSRLFVPAFLSCLCNALANMFWKIRFHKIPFSVKSFQDILGLFLSPHIWTGICCYGCSMLLFFYMLSNFKLSAIVPATCMTYIFNIVIAKIVFHESVSKMQMAGIVVVICGLFLISRSTVQK